MHPVTCKLGHVALFWLYYCNSIRSILVCVSNKCSNSKKEATVILHTSRSIQKTMFQNSRELIRRSSKVFYIYLKDTDDESESPLLSS